MTDPPDPILAAAPRSAKLPNPSGCRPSQFQMTWQRPVLLVAGQLEPLQTLHEEIRHSREATIL